MTSILESEFPAPQNGCRQVPQGSSNGGIATRMALHRTRLIDLPEGAEQQEDGTVKLPLKCPVTLRQMATSALPKGECISELRLHRLFGIDMRKVLAANGARMSQVALARSAKLPPSKMAAVTALLEEEDLAAANAVVVALCDLASDGLPARAVQSSGMVRLPLQQLANPTGFPPRAELVFYRLRGDDLIAIHKAKEIFPASLARATRISQKEADAIFDAMDAADLMAANRVIRFLSQPISATFMRP